MKQLFTLLSCVFILSVSAQTRTTLLIAPSTASTTTGTSWTFSNGCTVSNAASKAYSTGTYGTYTGVKFSVGVQYTITIPSGVTIDTVSYYGYDNYTGPRTYFTEFNGVANTDSLVNYFTAKIDASTPVLSTANQIPASAISNSFTFTLAGKQAVLQLTLRGKSTVAGISAVSDTETENKPVDVYAIDGRRIKTNVFQKEAIKELPNGIYIVNNKKLIVNHNY